MILGSTFELTNVLTQIEIVERYTMFYIDGFIPLSVYYLNNSSIERIEICGVIFTCRIGGTINIFVKENG